MKRAPLKRGTSMLKRSGFYSKSYFEVNSIKNKELDDKLNKKAKQTFGKTRKALRKKSISPSSKAKSALWAVFSLFIKLRDNWTCFTCGIRIVGPKMGAGHFIEKSVGGLRLYFHQLNVHAQCENCNCYLPGNREKYEKRMISVYGIGIVNELKRIQHQEITKNFDFAAETSFFKARVAGMYTKTHGPVSAYVRNLLEHLEIINFKE